MPEHQSFVCPRCARAAVEEFYGPCGTCVATLRALGGPAVAVHDVEYSPKMNVTPNFVATKD